MIGSAQLNTQHGASHVFWFTLCVMQPGQVCRMYTNEYHPKWCGFSYRSGSALWNNGGGCAYLRDSTFTLIGILCYLNGRCHFKPF